MFEKRMAKDASGEGDYESKKGVKSPLSPRLNPGKSIKNGGGDIRLPSSKTNGNTTEKQSATTPRPVFEYPDLPKWETGLHYFICTCMFIISWSVVGYYSSLTPKRLLDGIRFGYEQLPLFNIYRHRDYCDFEWKRIFDLGYKWAAALGGHSIVLEIADRTLGDRRKAGGGSEQIVKLIVIAYSLVALLFTFASFQVLALLLVEAAGVFVLCKLVRYQIVPWIYVTAMYYLNMQQIKDKNLEWEDYNRIFIGLLVQQYSLFQYVSYCVEEIIWNPTPGISLPNQIINYLFYLFYYPFKLYLIMPYRLFEKRWRERGQQGKRDWKHIISYGLRLWFWFYVCEYCCFFFYFKPIVRNLHLYPANIRTSITFLCLCYFAMGNFFHLKYVVIFGIPSLFLEIDRMQPLPPPICVARVSLYSRMWREFDRGLYLFIKDCVYKPICRPTFSIQRKLIAGVTVFLGEAGLRTDVCQGSLWDLPGHQPLVRIRGAFVLSEVGLVVLIWHTANKAITVWIILNISVLIMKGIGTMFYNRCDAVYKFCHETLSPVNLRRFIAVLQIPLVILSVVGLAYFLAGSPRGDVAIYYMIWDAWWLNPGWKILGECAIAYSFGQFSISCNKWWEAREKAAAAEKERETNKTVKKNK